MIVYPNQAKPTMDDYRRMIQKIQLNSTYSHSTWVSVGREKIKPKFTYQQYIPAGYTDDLGIIADKNQWVDGQQEGWRSEIDPQDYQGMREWCIQNLKHGTWYTGIYYIFIEREEDVAWFMLRWS